MCILISVILPSSAHLPQVEASFGQALVLNGNPNLLRQLGDGEQDFVRGDAGCDCDTPLGALRREKGRTFHSHERARLRKQGWSEADFERAVEESVQQAKEGLVDPSAELTSLRDRVAAVVQDGVAESVGLLWHWYSGQFASEDFPVSERVEVPVDGLQAADLAVLRENVLCVVRGGSER